VSWGLNGIPGNLHGMSCWQITLLSSLEHS